MLAVLAFVAAASMGADSDARDIAMSPIGAVDASTVTIDAMPYARTVACGTYTLTGSASGSTPLTWSASPSGATGDCYDTSAPTTTSFKWLLDEPSGTTWTDEWNSEVLTASGSITAGITGKIDEGVTFAGGYAEGDASTALTGYTALTWNVWARRNANATPNAFQYVMDQRQVGTGGIILLIDDDSGYQPFVNVEPGNLFANGGTTMTLGVWRMLTVTWDGTTVRLWVDGVLQTATQTTATVNDSAYALRVGSNARSTLAFGSSDISIDDMRVYPYVLSSSQIAGIYASGAPASSIDPEIFYCPVDVDPDAVGEGVETITVSAGSASDTETIGFYVDGEHSCFLSQSVDGDYNGTLADLDAVSTWENLGSSALDVTQGTGSAQPTFRTSIVGGQPVVRCDGGDGVVAATASDWAFLNDSADYSLSWVAATSSSNPNAAQVVLTTRNVDGGSGSRGFSSSFDDRAAIPTNDRANLDIRNGTGAICTIAGTADSVPSARFNDVLNVHDDDGGAGVDFTMFANGSSVGTCSGSPTYSSSAPASPLRLCQNFTSAGFNLTGDLFRVLIYQSALTSTQRGINEAVDEWALGGTLPVTP